jgi:hypothetical protein
MEDNKFKLTLKINGKNKTFVSEPTGRIVYRAAEVAEDLAKAAFNTELLDELADFVVELFQSQFTHDELIDGIGVADLGKVLLGYTSLLDKNSVLNRFFSKGESLPNQKAGSVTNQ